MYNNVFRSCINVAGKFCSSVVVSRSRQELLVTKFTLFDRTPSFVHYVLSKQDYCTDICNMETFSEQDRNAQKELALLFKQPEKHKLFKVIELEIEIMRNSAERVPDNIRPKEWLNLINLQTKSRRRRLLEFLWTNEKKAENIAKKKEIQRAANVQKFQEKVEAGTINYGLRHNSMFLRIYPKMVSDFLNNKLIQAMLFDPVVVFDLGYDEHMTQMERTNCVKQLIYSFSNNRQHISPFNLYFCNAKKSKFLDKLKLGLPTMFDDEFPLNVTESSYLDVFDKDKLIYLTPHTNVDMKEYDPDKIYIIGAMVDKSTPQPISLAKAKKEGIKAVKFPLEKYLDWGAGSGKSLTLNQVLSILLDLRFTKDWKTALQHVPTRKLKQAREHVLRQKIEQLTTLEEAKVEEMNTKYEVKLGTKERISLINKKIII